MIERINGYHNCEWIFLNHFLNGEMYLLYMSIQSPGLSPLDYPRGLCVIKCPTTTKKKKKLHLSDQIYTCVLILPSTYETDVALR